jgi:hypothetical protein
MLLEGTNKHTRAEHAIEIAFDVQAGKTLEGGQPQQHPREHRSKAVIIKKLLSRARWRDGRVRPAKQLAGC